MNNPATGSRRFALGVEYDGSIFHGWQTQDQLPTVQAALEAALARVADHPLTTICAGRTDTGVHAAGQVVHFDARDDRPLKAWVLGTNAHLCREIRVRWVRPVPSDFHARFSARDRTYRYVIYNARQPSAMFSRWLTHDYRPLDAGAMAEAAQTLIGEHDFSSFRAANCQSETAVRAVQRCRVWRRGVLVAVEITANAFLHHMVRNIVGVLCDIGAGKLERSWMAELLRLRDRTRASVTAPPDGLYLARVTYPQEYELPNPAPSLLDLIDDTPV